MLRLMLKAVALVGIAAAPVGLAGCSDSLSATDTSFAEVSKDYKNTLSSGKKKAVINEMRKEQERVQKAAGLETAETTASTKPAKKKKQPAAPAEAAQN